jgi:hypothetical protein
MYDAETGLFLAPDPAQTTTSSYGYAKGNPTLYVDPTGMVDQLTTWKRHQAEVFSNSEENPVRMETAKLYAKMMRAHAGSGFMARPIFIGYRDGKLYTRKWGESWAVNDPISIGNLDINSLSHISISDDGTIQITCSLTQRYRNSERTRGNDDGPGDLLPSEYEGVRVYSWIETIHASQRNSGQFLHSFAEETFHGDMEPQEQLLASASNYQGGGPVQWFLTTATKWFLQGAIKHEQVIGNRELYENDRNKKFNNEYQRVYGIEPVFPYDLDPLDSLELKDFDSAPPDKSKGKGKSYVPHIRRYQPPNWPGR